MVSHDSAGNNRLSHRGVPVFSGPLWLCVIRVGLTADRSLPVFPDKRTCQAAAAMSQRCQKTIFSYFSCVYASGF